MKFTKAFICIVALFLICGCVQPEKKGYSIWFDGAVTFMDKNVYKTGVVVGEIIEHEVRNNVTMMKIKINGSDKNVIRNNVAAYLSSGRIILTSIGNYGQLIEENKGILGFSSKGSLAFFKFTSLLGNTVMAADQEKEKLSLIFHN